MNTKWIRSWNGVDEHGIPLSTYRDQIRSMAKEVVSTDLKVRTKYPSSIATGLICQAMGNLSISSDPDVVKAAKAQNDLFELHALLVSKGLEYDFVCREWYTILDPSPENKARCDKLAKPSRKR
jgi:hypothetical protein